MDDVFSLSGMVVVITGAGGLLGGHHAEAVARAGGTPILLDIAHQRISTLAEDINKRFGCKSLAFAVDITDEMAVEKNCTQILSLFGKIDGLVNNAANNPAVSSDGLAGSGRIEHFSVEDWSADLAVGLTGAFICSKHYGSAIAKQGGSIVNISSDLGLIGPDQRLYRKIGVADDQQPAKPVTYSVVKSGIIGLTKWLATYWAEQGVRCNALCPGGVENNQSDSFIADVKTRIPMGRMAHPDEYSGSLIYLLSSASSYVTGAVLVADGGRTAW